MRTRKHQATQRVAATQRAAIVMERHGRRCFNALAIAITLALIVALTVCSADSGSPNQKTLVWTAVPNNPFTGFIFTITYSNSKFIAGSQGAQMASSTNGTTWTAVTQSVFESSHHIMSIVFGEAEDGGSFFSQKTMRAKWHLMGAI